MMKNYVISLTTASARRDHIIREFGKQGVDFEFFDAITPEQVPSLAKTFHINIENSSLTQGELACLFSHVCLWQKAIDDNLDYIAIFEDDIYLGENADTFLNNTDWIPQSCGLIKIEHFIDKLHLGRSVGTIANRAIKPLKEFNWGTAGYLINQEMIDELLSLLQTMQILDTPIDHLMFEYAILQKHLPVYQLTPALCVQSDRPNEPSRSDTLKSTLENERQQQRAKVAKIQLDATQKLIRECKRPLLQLKALIQKQTVTFK
ncbi:LgtB [Moraxella catarrhalis]|uniref:LgtB n=2 Tax=Moraxella catarrhalis TaxID=480 RepID=A0A198UDK5_MORCA|nr:LgtB [Moraxella catarrhalis]OAU95778.1 LgtB [Moraxella catarrhalis]OAU99439.1 LgtB [Moraxella catarrhalis]